MTLEHELAMVALGALAAALAWALSFSSFNVSSYKNEKVVGLVLWLLAKNSRTFILVVSVWALGPHRNS
jgi:ABC-type uncharacterized transport system permease subunit